MIKLQICEERAVDFTHAMAARDEALTHRLDDQQAIWLADACRRRRSQLGDSGVLAHSVAYDPKKWPDLPQGIGDGKSVARGDVFNIADLSAINVFAASYVFGMGRTGYGRSRYDAICASAADLGDVLERVREIGRCQGPVVAYSQLYGGHDHENRGRPGTSAWSRIAGYGPAFFTKFVYFTVPGTLILDARLARRVARLIGHKHGYLNNGRTVAWTPYRYAVYLHWMTQAAATVSRHTAPYVVCPSLLELTLFGLELSDVPDRTGSGVGARFIDSVEPEDEGDAAD